MFVLSVIQTLRHKDPHNLHGTFSQTQEVWPNETWLLIKTEIVADVVNSV